jgi:glycosyltransferase involved in cell wall biosynthesis
MLAYETPEEIPLIISIWGNDLTLHAQGSFFMRRLTREVLSRADGLIADTKRDIGLGQEWGFSRVKPTLVAPGSGGIRMKEISFNLGNDVLWKELPDGPIIVNPRGQRPGSLRQDVFFQAIPMVLAEVPQAFFICPSLEGDVEAEKWVDNLGIRSSTKLWPYLDQAQLWSLFRKSHIFVSPSIHDGTPNSFLEAMACGCFPIVGNIESMWEWIQPGINGLLVDASDARSIADAVVQAIRQPTLQKSAAKINAALIEKRAEYTSNMASVELFYNTVKSRK